MAIDFRGALDSPWQPSTILLATTGVLTLIYITWSFLLSTLSTEARFWQRQAFVGKQKRWFADFWARVHSFTGTRAMVHDGYALHSKEDQPFALPQFADKPLMILPPTTIKELLQKPDEDVNLLIVLREALAAKYSGDEDLAVDPFHLDVVRHQLTRKLPLLTADVHTELVLGFEDQWKVNSTEWTAIPVFKTSMNIISRAANRVFSGEELCRNQAFLDHARDYGSDVFTNAGIINMLPRMLRPVFAPLITLKNKGRVRTCQKIAVPVIAKRIAEKLSNEKSEPKTDALQWVIEEAIKRNDPIELDPGRICRRILRLNTVAIHTTSITITNTLLDLYSSPRVEESVESLREECSRVLSTHNGQWTKAAVNDLIRIDSTIKESIRCSSLGIVGLTRMVTAQNGLSLGDDIHIPAGVRVAMPIAGVHKDPRNYQSPEEYDAFRFSRSRETFDQNGDILDKRNQGIVTTSDSFLTFGHGRHACPGRFFASQEMKIFLAHVVMNYDLRIDGERPKNWDFKGACIPPPRAKIQVRKRQKQ